MRKLLTELGGFACPHCSAERSWVLASRLETRLNSVTAIARCRNCGESIFLKQILPTKLGEAVPRARHEYQVARELHGLFSNQEGVGVVAPLYRADALLVFEYIAGKSPLGVLRGGSTDEATKLMQRLGDWFGRFHGACGHSKGGIDLDEKYRDLSRCFWIGPPRSKIAHKALVFLENCLADFKGRVVPHRRLHGDAKPDNFLIAGERIFGIDIDGSFRNPPEYDMAQFLSQFLLTASGLLGVVDEKRVSALEIAFLDGYCDAAQFDPDLLAWLKVYFLISFWLSWRSPSLLHRLRWDWFFERRLDYTFRYQVNHRVEC